VAAGHWAEGGISETDPGELPGYVAYDTHRPESFGRAAMIA
jgi:hypothetical protein